MGFCHLTRASSHAEVSAWLHCCYFYPTPSGLLAEPPAFCRIPLKRCLPVLFVGIRWGATLSGVWIARHLHRRKPVGCPAVPSQASQSSVLRAPVLTVDTWEGQVLSPVKRKRKEVSFTQLLSPFCHSFWGVRLFVCNVLFRAEDLPNREGWESLRVVFSLWLGKGGQKASPEAMPALLSLPFHLIQLM